MQRIKQTFAGKMTYNHLTLDTTQFSEGIILAPTFLVKGLEFDAVIVIDADKDNFSTEIDKQALYVACTRAMHELRIMFKGELTKFIK